MKTTKSEKAIGLGIIAGAILYIAGILAVLGVVIWAIIKLVTHFTG